MSSTHLARRRCHPSQSVTAERGFTLIELLVVIAIIALLVGILLPALANARKSAQQVKCLSQVRQTGLAMTQYANDQKNWYPLIPFNSSGWQAWNNASGRSLSEQWVAGGVAGFFSLFQNPDGGDSAPVGDYGFVSAGNYATAEYSQPRTDPSGRVLQRLTQPILKAYIEGFGILTCPADREDRNYGPQATFSPSAAPAMPNAPVKIPKTPANEFEVISYNVSYLYIAGFKTDEGVIIKPAPLWGDETNAPDLSTRAWYYGSQDRPTGSDIRAGFMAKADNHGTDGANYVFTDGHGELVKYDIQDTFFSTSNSNSQSVNVIDRNRSRRVQTID